MKKLMPIVLIVVLAFGVLPTRAQETESVNINPTLLERFIGSSRETILYKLPVGDYEVSITGERFPDKGYFCSTS